jgi:outer membrane biosynthesis protein TonB
MVASPAPSNDKPRFRQDLVAEPVEDGATRFIDVADPDTGNLFRFYEVEYSLACAMDGDRDVAGIVQWAKEELGLATSPKEVQNVIATLRDLGYLESGAAAAAAAAPTHVEKPVAPPPEVKPAPGKWDAPAASGDPDLKPGVIAAKPAPVKMPAADDLELGNAGTTPAKVEAALPRAPELELGAPGATSTPARVAPPAKAADVALGSAGRSEVSADLSDHMDISAADVKEAVRASQVMKAVDVPKELLESVEKPEPKVEKKPEPKVEAKKPEPKPEPKVEAKPEPKPEPKVEAKPEPTPEPKVEKRPAVAAKEPPTEEKRPVAPPAPKSGASGLLIGLLVIAILGAGAFFAYKYVFKKKDTGAQSTATQPVPPKQPEPPPPPPVESEKLATEQQEPVDLKAVSGGQLETIVANDTAVKTGDTVAMFAGHKPLETEIAAMQKDIDNRVKPELDKATKDRDAATAAGNKAAITAAEARIADRQKSLSDKQTKLEAKKAELGKLQIKAPADGKVTAVAKANTKVAANDVVAKLTKAPVLTATFKSASGVTPQSHVLLAVKDGDQKLSCTVATADASGVKVECPQGAATEGAEVTFVGPDPSAPAAAGSAGEIDMNDEGSAAKAPETDTPGSAAETPAPPPAPKAPAKVPAKAPVRAKAPAKPAETPSAKPAETPSEKPAEAPAPAPAPEGGDTLK